MTPRRWLLALLVGLLLLPGCGDGGGEETVEGPSSPRRLGVALDGYDGPENVGILMAEKLGYFADVAIEPSITSPASPARALLYVAAGTSDIGVSHQPQVVLAGSKGVPVVAVGSLVSQPTAAMIWLEGSEIDEIADLKGKTIAFPGVPFQKDLLESILAQAGLTLADVSLKNVEYDLTSALVSGRADAIFGGSANVEGVELEERGLEPVVTPVTDLGVPAYDELVVIAHSDRVAEEPQLIRDFMAAVARGTAAAIEDPQAAAAVIEEGVEKDPDLTSKITMSAVEATLPVLSESGEMDTGQAEELIEWMREEGMIRREPPASALFTNDYLESPE